MQENFIFSTSHWIPHIAICIFFGAIQQVVRGGGQKKQQKMTQTRPVQSKKWCPSNKFFYALFSVTQSLLILGSNHSLTILQRATKRTHPRKSIPKHLKYYLHKNILIPLLCQCELFIHTYVSENLIASKYLIFYLFWYNVIRCRSHISKNLLFSHSIVSKSNE